MLFATYILAMTTQLSWATCLYQGLSQAVQISPSHTELSKRSFLCPVTLIHQMNVDPLQINIQGVWELAPKQWPPTPPMSTPAKTDLCIHQHSSKNLVDTKHIHTIEPGSYHYGRKTVGNLCTSRRWMYAAQFQPFIGKMDRTNFSQLSISPCKWVHVFRKNQIFIKIRSDSPPPVKHQKVRKKGKSSLPFFESSLAVQWCSLLQTHTQTKE